MKMLLVDLRHLTRQLRAVMKIVDHKRLNAMERTSLDGLENLLSELRSALKDDGAVMIERTKP